MLLRRLVCGLFAFGLGLSTATLFAQSFDNEAGTVVRLDTNFGLINIRLTDDVTPATVANFLSYVNDNSWDGSFFHRLIPNFVLQGGGFKYDDAKAVVDPVVAKDPVVNEFHYSNTRGTIAMAKVDGDPDSATHEWFINLVNNASNLDNQNGGFTVFGNVIGDGMDVVDTIAALQRVNAGSPFDNLPVHDWSGQTLNNSFFVLLNDVTVVPAYQNPLNQFDANHDGVVTPLDVLQIINDLNLNGVHDVAAAYSANANYLDVNGDGSVQPLDVLTIINYINTHPVSVGPLVPLGLLVPEPATWAIGLMGMGILAIGLRRR